MRPPSSPPALLISSTASSVPSHDDCCRRMRRHQGRPYMPTPMRRWWFRPRQTGKRARRPRPSEGGNAAQAKASRPSPPRNAWNLAGCILTFQYAAGGICERAEATDKRHWARQWRDPVRQCFMKEIRAVAIVRAHRNQEAVEGIRRESGRRAKTHTSADRTAEHHRLGALRASMGLPPCRKKTVKGA